MPAASSQTELLLAEIRNRMVVPQSYSRRSLLSRCMPAMTAALLAFVAVIGGMLLCEITAPNPPASREAGARSIRPS
ncbi:MAG: hypothetical protein HIU86_03565 [Acidobacteria bacterium]|nr:hypothetical protein [Acidobacteriota bacterium]